MKNLLALAILLNSIAIYAQNADITLLRWIHNERNVCSDQVFSILSQTTKPISIAAPLLVYGFGSMNNNKSTQQKGLMMGASLFAATAVTTTLKYTINRERPYNTYPDIGKISMNESPSFPSGHTSNAFALATSVSLAFPKWYVIAPSYVYASAVGYSRMHLGVHYPSDVIAGAVVGAGSAYLCYKAQKWISNQHRNKKGRPRIRDGV